MVKSTNMALHTHAHSSIIYTRQTVDMTQYPSTGKQTKCGVSIQ